MQSKSHFILILLFIFSLGITACNAQEVNQVDLEQSQPNDGPYQYRRGDPNGIGKWYMGREIAHVMGYQAMDWLDREEREQEEKTKKLIENMNIQPKEVIADIGAGSGYHVFKMAPLANEGAVYAIDIQAEMLQAINLKNKDRAYTNIKLVKGSEQSSNLPQDSIDKILMVDVYHEFNYPKEMLESMYEALKANGKIYLIEYRKEDRSVPIKEVHKMTETQAVKEFKASGFVLIENIDNLPWQHCMVFGKK